MSTPHTHLNTEEIEGLMQSYRLKVLKSEKTRKVFRVKTSQGEFALKPTQMIPNSIGFIQRVLVYLARQGFPADPFIPTVDGQLYSTYGNTRFLVSPWFHGREADFDRLGDLMFGVKLLARFHRDSRGFDQNDVPLERRYAGRWPEIFAGRIHQLETFNKLAKAGQEHFDRLYRRFLPYFMEQAEASLSSLKASPYAQIVAVENPFACLCHHDYSGRNLLVSPTDCLLLDFDYCIADLNLHDLANLMLRLLRHDNWRTNRARFALMIYHRQNPLTPNHLRVLHEFLRWPQDFWQIGLQYYMEKLPWPTERFIKTLKKKLADEAARQRFLRDFPEQNGVYSFRSPPYWKVGFAMSVQ